LLDDIRSGATLSRRPEYTSYSNFQPGERLALLIDLYRADEPPSEMEAVFLRSVLQRSEVTTEYAQEVPDRDELETTMAMDQDETTSNVPMAFETSPTFELLEDYHSVNINPHTASDSSPTPRPSVVIEEREYMEGVDVQSRFHHFGPLS
jgi:hypothetical protein